ncbi:MAG: hypothetical protein ACJ73U_08845, partial [Actinophytocola sp.]
IAAGKYKGRRAVEVRLDGRRVGELTYLMSQRYAPLVTQVSAHNGRAGCEAEIERDANGLQLTLRLPRDAEAPGPVDAPTVVLPAPVPAPSVPAPSVPVASTFTRHRTAWLVAAAVVVVLFFAALASNGDESTRNTAGDETTTTTDRWTATSTTAPTTTPSPTTTPPPPPPTSTAVVPPPPPQPTTEQPAPPPAEQPAPQQQCAPNSTGCVPIASDVDCAGGSGNGPAYVRGPVRVIGRDIYDLDRDGNGIACE